ncbi:MAG: hypothetical protein HY514_05155 [Candidatus Aenigmarchaeota archaeon]|nr:hypothetical protein [Candidatus Aenigmarchaeota archaeon]
MKSRINTIVLAVVATVFVAGCTSGPSTDVAPQPGTGDIVNVAVTDSGFVPEVVEIDAGDTVVWTNSRTNVNVWPASDDHPTHTKLPGFDPLRGIGKGQTYQFTFTKSGEWRYHDHLHPAVEGLIRVK